MSAQLELQFQHRRRASTNRQRPKVRDEDRKRIAVAFVSLPRTYTVKKVEELTRRNRNRCDHCKTRKIRCMYNLPLLLQLLSIGA